MEITTPLGAEVVAGQVLAHLESPEIGGLRAELNESEALLEIAQENYERERRLEERGISSRSELLDAQAELRSVEARARGAEERLRVMGAGRDEEGGHFDITAPFDGVVVERHAARGEVVGSEDQILTVADLSQLWVEFDIYEPDLARVSLGLNVEVQTSAWADQSFPGVITYLSDILDPVRRTIRARVEVANPERSLKPGMFATARGRFRIRRDCGRAP